MKLSAKIILIIILILVLGSYIFKNNTSEQIVENIEPYRATLSGEYVCLPHKDTTGPQTDECALGLRSTDGKYYSVNLQMMSQSHKPLEVGQKIKANGTVHPVEMLSSDHWQKYPIVGIFSITDSLEII